MAIIYLGIGSNLGNRQTNIKNALALLAKNDISIIKNSTIIETEPVGEVKQKNFLNTVVKAETILSPFDLLSLLNNIEKQLGRVRSFLNGPRTIDIDILLYDNIIVDTPQLTIPHPRMYQRDFVMLPLKEIEPNFAKEILHANN